MQEITGNGSERAPQGALTELAAHIHDSHWGVQRCNREAVEHAIRCGALLDEAKERVPQGRWLEWLAEDFEPTVRTAQLYMRLAKRPDCAIRISHLGFAGVCRELFGTG